MEELDKELSALIAKMPDEVAFRDALDHLESVYPFNRYEYIVSSLLDKKLLTFDSYVELRTEYINRNLFLPLFEITAPRGFGDIWALGHLLSIEPAFLRPTKKMDASYRGEYDLLLPYQDRFIKIEVKSSRVVDRDSPDEPLYLKALSSRSHKRFLMNFQQLKPSCCDVFLWLAVYRDCVRYWVLNRETIRSLRAFTPQHRNIATSQRAANYSHAEIFEGQVMMTDENIQQFTPFRVDGKDLCQAVVREFERMFAPGAKKVKECLYDDTVV